MWFGWTRDIGVDVVKRIEVSDPVLDHDAEIDHRDGCPDRML